MKHRLLFLIILGMLVFTISCSCARKITYSYNDNSFNQSIDSSKYQKTSDLSITEGFDNLYIDWANGNVTINQNKGGNTLCNATDFYYYISDKCLYIRPYGDNEVYSTKQSKDITINLSMFCNPKLVDITNKQNVTIETITINTLKIKSDAFVSLTDMTIDNGSIEFKDQDVNINKVMFNSFILTGNNGNITLNPNNEKVNYLVVFNTEKGKLTSNLEYQKVENKYGFGNCDIDINIKTIKGNVKVEYQK